MRFAKFRLLYPSTTTHFAGDFGSIYNEVEFGLECTSFQGMWEKSAGYVCCHHAYVTPNWEGRMVRSPDPLWITVDL